MPECPEDSSTVMECTEGVSMLPLIDEPDQPINIAAYSVHPREDHGGYERDPRSTCLGTARVRVGADLWKPQNFQDGCVMGNSMITDIDGHEFRYTEWSTYRGPANDWKPDWSSCHGVEIYNHTGDPGEDVNLAPRHFQEKEFKLWKFNSKDGSLLMTLQTRLRDQMASMNAIKRDLVKRLDISKRSKGAARRRFQAAKAAAAEVADKELAAQREEEGLSTQEDLSPRDLVKRLSSKPGRALSEDEQRFEAAKEAAAELAERELQWQLAQNRAAGEPAMAQPVAYALQPEGKARH